MIRRHSILIGLTLSLILFIIAASCYPGGSQNDPGSIGYDWRHNYLCNLFSPEAVNGVDNSARYWAIPGMLVSCISIALFFFKFSAKITTASSAKVIKYFGVGSMVCAFLVVTPYHDMMTTIGCTCALVSLFYISVFVFKSKLYLFKILSIICMGSLYFTSFIYYTQNLLKILPIMQKVSFLLVIIWILGLDYFTRKEDFSGKNSQI